MRYNILIMAGGMLAALGAASPGLVRTIFTLFDNPSDNSSIAARLRSHGACTFTSKVNRRRRNG